MVATRLSNSIGLAYANTEACMLFAGSRGAVLPYGFYGPYVPSGWDAAGCRQPAMGLPVPVRPVSGRGERPMRPAAILLAQALPYPNPRDQNCAPRYRSRGGYSAPAGSPRYLRGLGTRRGLDRRGLDRQTPNGIDLEIPFPNPASTAGTSFTPDMSNPSRRERDDED